MLLKVYVYKRKIIFKGVFKFKVSKVLLPQWKLCQQEQCISKSLVDYGFLVKRYKKELQLILYIEFTKGKLFM